MQVKGIFKKPKQEQPDLLGDIVSIHKLVQDLEDTKSTAEQVIKEAETVTRETQQASDESVKKIDDKVAEFEQTAIKLIEDINAIPHFKGDPGKDAVPVDEEKLSKSILSKIEVPKVDEKALINKVISALPENKASLKIIKEEFKADPLEIANVIAKLPPKDFQINTENIKDLDLKLRLIETNSKGYIHGGGFNNIYSSSTLVSNGLTGLNFTGSGVASVTKNASTGIITVDISGGGSGSVTSVTGTSPIVIDNTDPTQPIVTIQVANTSQSGYLSSTDWNIFNNKGSGTVTSVSGTTNRITSTGGTIPVIDISASYVGQTSITTLGTISTGVWGGTVISLASGGTGSNLSDPGANKILAWDDTDNTVGFWTLGTNLSYDHATHTLNATGGGGSGTVTDFIFTDANGFDGTVTLSTSTPTLSLTTTVTSGQVMFSNSGAIVGDTDMTFSGSRLTVTDLTVTNTIIGSISGNAATVTTNANLTGPITSVGNATTIASSVALPGSPTTTTQTFGDSSTKIATTAFVQAAITGTTILAAANVATTALLVGNYSNGVSGVGATFTYTATGVDTIDGVVLTLGMRVLVKNQSSTFQNGIYSVTTAGAIGIAGILTRTTDYDQSAEVDIGDTLFVISGTAQGGTTWTQNGTENPIMGTDPITFVQTAGPGTFTAGNGLTLTGTSFSIDTTITADLSTTQTFTNKTLTSPKINENVALTTTATKLNFLTSAAGTTGTTSTNIVFSTSPTLTTPVLGVATYTTLSGGAITNSALTAGRVTFAGTAGLLSDDANFTFSVDTLTVTKIAATTYTGTQTYADAVNLVFNTTTGTKIGTGTTQKIGFFNATPIVQPTGDVITALQNLGLGASLTITATSITARTLWGQTYDGTGNVSGSQTGIGDMTGGASSMTITAGTGNSRTLTLRTTTSSGTATAAITLDDTQKATFSGHLVVEGVTSTGATGTGKFVFDTAPTFTTSITTPSVLATANDSGALGASGTAFSDLFLASGAVINFVAGDYTLTHSSGILTANKDLRITTAGSDATSVLTQGSTNTITSKTLSSSTNVLGGVTMTLGSDADGDIYYRASNVLTRLAKGTSSQVLIGGTTPSWGSAPSSVFPAQDLALLATGTTGSTVQTFTATDPLTTTGTPMFICFRQGNTTAVISRWVQDTNTKIYYQTHTTTLAIDSGSLFGCAVLGSFVYIQALISSTGALRRYDIADLGNVTTMTISGTNSLGVGPALWSDGTQLYCQSSAGNFRVYTVSSTTATAGSTIGYTSSGTCTSATGNATNVYITDSNGVGTINIRKYPIAGGAVTSTTTLTLNLGSWDSGGANPTPQLWLATATQLGISWEYVVSSATAVIGLRNHLTAITLP